MLELGHSHDRIGCWRSLPDDQDAWEPTPMDDGFALTMGGWGLPCIVVITEAALAGTSITVGLQAP